MAIARMASISRNPPDAVSRRYSCVSFAEARELDLKDLRETQHHFLRSYSDLIKRTCTESTSVSM